MACSASSGCKPQVMPVWPIFRRLGWAVNVSALKTAAATFAKFRRPIRRDILFLPFTGTPKHIAEQVRQAACFSRLALGPIDDVSRAYPHSELTPRRQWK